MSEHIQSGRVQEIHIMGADVGEQSVRKLTDFINDWGDVLVGNSDVDPTKQYIGIVHESGAYLVEIKQPTRLEVA